MKIMELKLLKIVVYLFVESSHTLSVTLFLIKEEISFHKSGEDTFVTCLDGESIVMPTGLPYAVYGKEQFKML